MRVATVVAGGYGAGSVLVVRMSIHEQLVDSLALQIAEYLDLNTQAADGAEGILRWWLRDPQEGKNLERVQAALDLLEARGVVMRNVLKDGHVIYRRAPGQENSSSWESAD
jgi:hypothetical protein